MIARIEAWLKKIIAEVVAKAVSDAHVSLVRLHNETTVSLRDLDGMQREALRLLALVEKQQPQCCAEKQKLLLEFRDKFWAFKQKFDELHPTPKV